MKTGRDAVLKSARISKISKYQHSMKARFQSSCVAEIKCTEIKMCYL